MEQEKDKKMLNGDKDIEDISKLFNMLDPENSIFDKPKILIKQITNENVDQENK